MKKIFPYVVLMFAFLANSVCANTMIPVDAEDDESINVVSNTLPLADPYILVYDGMYYIYGTNANIGFDVYFSKYLEDWQKASALSLEKSNSYGEKWFWAPEVYYVEKEKKFCMFYSTEEHICVATSDSPLGPFKQEEKKPIREEKGIDTSVFFDDDGKAYLYFVRFTDGVIWCAELKDNLREIKDETLTQCVKAEDEWELILPKVTEGPSVIKKDGEYYLIYSANGYTSQDYAVGFARSKSPYGPWEKYEYNPVLHKNDGLFGVGHGAPFVDLNGKMRYVFHAHKSKDEIHPRDSYIVDMDMTDGKISIGGNIIKPKVVDKLP